MNKETICKDKNCKFFRTCLIKDIEILKKCTGREKKVKVEK
ncbi:MAG: hypothetical protein RSD77_10020 [Romboutsia sp.]